MRAGDADDDKAIRANATKLLVVEGKNEKDAFRKHFDERSNVQVISCNGKDKLEQFLKGLPIVTGFESQIERVVVVLDNDDDPTKTEEAAQRAMMALRKPHGFVAVPDFGISGMLEDVLLTDNVSTVEQQCLDQFFACASKTANGKARMQAWLAIRAPGRMLGPAINNGKVSAEGPEFMRLLARTRVELA